MADAGTQQHPLGIYFKVWGYLFALSLLSYLVDFYQFQGVLRWSLILIFMVLKAGLIMAVFMHMVWERISLIYAIVVPPLALGVLVLFMAVEADYTYWTRIVFTGQETEAKSIHDVLHGGGHGEEKGHGEGESHGEDTEGGGTPHD